MTCNVGYLEKLHSCNAVPNERFSSRSFGKTGAYRSLHYCNDPYVFVFSCSCSDLVVVGGGEV